MTSPQIYYPSRKRAGLLLLAVPLLLAMGSFLFSDSPWLGGSLIVLGLATLAGVALMLLPGKIYLKLDHEGIWVAGLRQARLTRWQDIRALDMMEIAGNRLITVEYNRPAHSTRPAALQATLLGPQVLASNIYTVPIEEIATEMQRRLARHLSPGEGHEHQP